MTPTKKSLLLRIRMKLYNLQHHWVSKYIVHIWFKGWYFTTEDEYLEGPFISRKVAESCLERYVAQLCSNKKED